MGLIRLAIYMLTRHVGRIIAGALLLVFGLIIGVTSHNVGYQHLTKGSGPFDVHVLDNGDIYIQDTASQTFYIVHEADFTPTVDTNTFPSKSSFTSLIYDNDSQSVDVKLTNGNQLSGTGYAVEQFAFVDTNGQNEKSFSTSNYQQNPNGFYQNNWPGGGTVAGAGALLLLLTFLMKRSKAPAYAGVPAAGAAMMQNQRPGMQPPYAQYPGIPPQGFPPNAMPPQPYANAYGMPPTMPAQQNPYMQQPPVPPQQQPYVQRPPMPAQPQTQYGYPYAPQPPAQQGGNPYGQQPMPPEENPYANPYQGPQQI